MEAKEAFKRLWSEIYNPRSAYPDVSLGDVQDVMISILMDGLEGSEEERWVLARLGFGPSQHRDLVMSWSVRAISKLEQPAHDAELNVWDAFYRREEEAGDKARTDIRQVLDRLIQDGRVLLSGDDDLLDLLLTLNPER